MKLVKIHERVKMRNSKCPGSCVPLLSLNLRKVLGPTAFHNLTSPSSLPTIQLSGLLSICSYQDNSTRVYIGDTNLANLYICKYVALLKPTLKKGNVNKILVLKNCWIGNFSRSHLYSNLFSLYFCTCFGICVHICVFVV